MLHITAQQSRFHNEAIEGSSLKEIVVKDLSISIGQKEILSHASFQLQVGKHYVLAGRNGIGKSTLLHAIASDQIPSIPQSVRVLLLGQTQSNSEDDLASLSLEDVSVLQRVVQSNKERERALHEERLLSTAIENSADPSAIVQAYRKVAFERLQQQTHEARQIVLRRSGARGAKAKKVLLQREAELEEAEKRLQQRPHEYDAAEIGEDSRKAADLLTEVQTSLELMDASGAEAKARSVLLGLGFSQESIDQPVARLSGGWKTRCSLASALCQSADLLLLDEPTNFLDLPSIIWLEQYIQDLDASVTVVAVTHDRAFADGVAEELLIMRKAGLERFRGNLSSYEIEREKKYKYLSRMKDAQDKQKKHIEKSIDQNVKAAKRTGDDKKLKQAASRKKKLDERMGMEVSSKGGKFKLNRDLAGYHLTNRDAIEVPDFDPPAKMALPTAVADLRFPGALVAFEKVSFAYKKQTLVLRDVSLTVHSGERVGLCGMNGSGKSTLVALAMAGSDETSGSKRPISGSVMKHTRARIGLYSQQAAEELDALAAEKPELTALSHLMECDTSQTEQEARGLLSGVGLAGRVASDVPIKLLSGGQKVRVALAKIFLKPPHLLILDEITTHLDTDTIDALIRALRDYEGAILVVTHDRFFMRCVVEGESPKRIARAYRPDQEVESEESEESEEETTRERTVYRLSKGKLTKLSRGMVQYEELAEKASAKLGKV